MSNYLYPLTEQNSKVNVYPVELVKVEELNIEKEQMGDFSKELLQKSVNNWGKALSKGMEEKLSLGMKLVGLEETSNQIVFNNEGLIEKFALLKTNKDIEAFSKKYGLLGIKHPDTEQVDSQHPAILYTLQPSFIFNDYGFSVFEPIQLWNWHINEVRQALKLYDAVRKERSDDHVYQVIDIKMHRGMFESLAEDRRITDRYFVHWTNGEPILMLPDDLEDKPILEIGQYTLSKILESRLSGGIQFGPGDLIRNPVTKGFKVLEKKYTHFLLAAIYYDLWQKINDDSNIYICVNESCGIPFVKSRRKKYCSDACKQDAYRQRLKVNQERGKQ